MGLNPGKSQRWWQEEHPSLIRSWTLRKSPRHPFRNNMEYKRCDKMTNKYRRLASVVILTIIATKLQAGQGWHSRSWLFPGPAPLFQSTHALIQCEAPGTRLKGWSWLGVSQLRPRSPAEARLLSTRRERWMFDLISFDLIVLFYMHG